MVTEDPMRHSTFRRLEGWVIRACEGTGSEHRTCSKDAEGCADPGRPGFVLIPANGPVLVGPPTPPAMQHRRRYCANRGIPCNSRLRHPASRPFGCRAERTPNSIEWVVHFVSITGEGSRPLGPGNGGPPKWRRSSHRKPAYAGVGQSPCRCSATKLQMADLPAEVGHSAYCTTH